MGLMRWGANCPVALHLGNDIENRRGDTPGHLRPLLGHPSVAFGTLGLCRVILENVFLRARGKFLWCMQPG
jgi:hypothetical protein